MPKTSVLLTSAGVASAVNVIKALRLQQELEVSIVAVDRDELAAGLHLADHGYVAPSLDDEAAYLDFLYETSRKHGVRALFPCYSRELSLIARVSAEFERLGVSTLLPSPDVIDLCNDKERVSRLVADLGIPIPAFVSPTKEGLPLFSRLAESSSSVGAVYVDSEHMLEYLKSSGKQRVYQEYVKGVEYTVDALCNRDSDVLFAGPRKRLATKAGQSVKGVTIASESLHDYTTDICKAIGMVGACNLQFIERGDQLYFIEINPRFAAGGLMLTVHAGANLPLAALKLMLDIPVERDSLKQKQGVIMTRYWNELFIEGQDAD